MTKKDYLKAAEWVQWIDTMGVGGWKEIDDAKKREPLIINTLGFVIEDTRTKLIIGQSLDKEDRQVDHIMVIPKQCVLNRWSIQ